MEMLRRKNRRRYEDLHDEISEILNLKTETFVKRSFQYCVNANKV